jgi:hypothetical protein
MLGSLPDGCAALLHFDPPWQYFTGTSGHGAAGKHYQQSPEAEIAALLARAYRVGAADSYLAVWCTFPKLGEWTARPRHERKQGEITAALLSELEPLLTPEQFAHFAQRMTIPALSPHEIVEDAGWAYISGGAWGKTGGLGVGYHFRGDAEILLLYRKGSPRPHGGSKTNLWLEPRTLTHSEKPQTALRALARMVPPGALVVEGYAGSGSMARACRATGREYIGCEGDPQRHALALVRLSQQEMAWEGVA